MKVVSMVTRYHFQQKGSDNFSKENETKDFSHDQSVPRQDIAKTYLLRE